MKAPIKMPEITGFLRDIDEPLVAGDDAKEGYSVPEIVVEYGNVLSKIVKSGKIIPLMFRCIKEAKISVKEIQLNEYNNNKIISEEEFNGFEKYLKSIGVDSIGYTKVNENLIFKGKQVLFKNAIVLLMEMKSDKIDQAPSLTANREIFRTYHELGVDVNKGARYLRNLGFNAQAGPAIGGDSNYVLLARDAGLGEIGKHGLLINEHFGPSLRLAVIYTDIENLPINTENKYKWIREFCVKCNACVKGCPTNAIFKETIVFDDLTEQHIDYRKCGVSFANDYGCTLCVKNCAFYKQDYNKLKERFNEYS